MSDLPALEVDLRLPLDRFELAVGFASRRPVTGIFGPSGAGKSSLLEAIAGLRPAARGVVRFGGDTWLDSAAGRRRPPERRRVGYVPQDGLLFPHLDVRGNLLAARRPRGSGPPREETLATVARLLELTPLLGRSVDTLSGGERQRVALGRALCSAPRLLLLDEPLAALDLPLRRRLLPFLRRVRAELTVPMLFVSHDPIEAQALGDELIVLREGRAIARGEPQRVLTDPEVFPLAEAEGFENVLVGRLAGTAEGLRTVLLGSGAEPVELRTVAGRGPAGSEVLVGIPAHEILIAREPPRGLSARNVLPAEVVELRAVAGRWLVTAALGPGVAPVVVEVAEMTPRELGLGPGERVYLVIKATSCRLYEGAAPAG